MTGGNFMKKRALGVVLASCLMIIGGCAASNQESGNHNTKKTGEIVSNSKKANVKSKDPAFKGKLLANPTISDDTVTLSFETVDVINDPENIQDIINSNGVVLNVSKEMFDKVKNSDEIRKGSMVEFILKPQPAMTFSIPPQIPGDSIESIELLN